MSYACRVQKGVYWIVPSKRMWKEAPRARHVIQAAENLDGASRILETYLQCIFRGAQLLQTMDDEDAAVTLQKQMPHFQRIDVEGYLAFALRMGGSGSVHLNWWGEVTNLDVPHGRIVKGPTLRAIAELSIDKPFLKRCLVWAAQQCPQQFVDSGNYCSWISGKLTLYN